MKPSVLAAAVLAVLALFAGPAAAQTVPKSTEQVKLSFAPLVKAVSPAVVNIYARRRVQQNLGPFSDPFFRRFFGEDFLRALPQERVQNSLGSGVIVREKGLVVTNNHVVGGASEIRIVLADRREFDGELLLVDERSDLAVLRILGEGQKFPYLELGDADAAEVGDLAVAIGNPFGLNQTVTFGIISATARTTQARINQSGFFIQTDAAINPGNSGGALVGMDGKLLGINTAIFSQSGGSIGIGFATPSGIVARVVESAEGGAKRVVRPWFGAAVQPVTSEFANSLGLERPMGVVVRSIAAGSPAEKAGLRTSDVLAAINGQGVDDERSVSFRLATLPPEGSTELKVLRGGRELALKMPLQPPPESPPRETTALTGRNPLAGATVANLSPAVAEELGLEMTLRGVVVTGVQSNSAASRYFQLKDQVVSINDQAVESVARLNELLKGSGGQWKLVIRRDGRTLTVSVRG
ncbi:MAG: Do family serine endopeptidase [Reyranellaceae bacterium]